jgi:uncharacterized protein (TIGR02246 family)
MMNLNGQQSDVDQATQAWIEAFNEHDAEKIAALYHSEAVLWGTFSPELITSNDGIRGYFEMNFQLNPPPNTSIGARQTRIYGDTAISSGHYSFEMDVQGQAHSVSARFSFTYRLLGDQWLIVDHHSSLLPA